MVQREVADRIAAAPARATTPALRDRADVWAGGAPVHAAPESFSPPPDVHSTVFRWRFAPRFAELGVEEAGFLRFVRQTFAQKRKTLANNLRAAGFSPAASASALAQAGVPAPGARRGIDS